MILYKNQKENILELLNNIELYLKNDINSLKIEKFACNNDYNKKLKKKLDSIISLLNSRNDDEMMIYGELMLVSEKIGNGLIGDKIFHTDTSNIKLNYIAKTINLLVDSLKLSMEQIIKILNEYSKYNYINKLNINLVSNDFKILYEGINTLRYTITEMLIENKAIELKFISISNIFLENIYI